MPPPPPPSPQATPRRSPRPRTTRASPRPCGGWPSPRCSTVRAVPGRLSALSVFLLKSILYGAFVWARRALHGPKRRFPARAVRLCVDSPCDILPQRIVLEFARSRTVRADARARWRFPSRIRPRAALSCGRAGPA
jgi:hypothetical protein